jgi:hypothetical protein
LLVHKEDVLNDAEEMLHEYLLANLIKVVEAEKSVF